MFGNVKWHDPDAKLDYLFDWSGSNVLPEGDAITSATVTSDADGVTVSAVTHTADTVTAWVEGGTPGQAVRLRCHIVTAAGREDDETGELQVRHR